MSDAAAATPLLDQYEGVKSRYPGHLVLFRVGDFYETFGDDAKLLSRELEVVLTARAPDAAGQRTPMAGVPYHAVETYLGRLVRKGYKVAVCDQVEDAKLAKGLVRREVTRVVSPGTVLEDRILPGPDHNFLASVVVRPGAAGAYAAVDLTTGEWLRGPAPSAGPDGLLQALAPLAPREVLVAAPTGGSDGAVLRSGLARELPNARVEPAPPPAPPSELPEALAAALSGDAEADLRLAAYVQQAQPRLLKFLAPAEGPAAPRRLLLDAKTLRHLEIARPMNPDDPDGATLIGTWDETVTAPGRRTLSFWLRNPLGEVGAIADRQDAVEALRGLGAGLLLLRSELKHVADLARIATRLAGRRVRPPELGALLEGLRAVDRARGHLPPQEGLPLRLRAVSEALRPEPELLRRLEAALPDPIPATVEDGGLFRPGYAEEVDRVVAQEREGLRELEALEKAEQAASGIRTLKIGYNQVFGYFFEVSRPNLARTPPHFRRKQTLSGGERFTSDALQRVEEKILTAREKARTLEVDLWERFLGELDGHVPALHRLARAVGELDALATFAHLAQSRGLVRPVVDESRELQVRDGRHPVLDRLLQGRFVPNDTALEGDGARVLVLTGPNMSGKSTYMRQVGLLVVLAQAGAFVPARFARIGVVSGLFTRMGFTDEIGRGKSSFMVEMTEVAEILRAADDRALVLLDEVGRGTSTFDGLALAWATLRHLHDRSRCRTLLATHYHQLTELIERLPAARNAHLAVRESGDEVVFLHRLVPGSTDRSYGLHVARLAGLPSELVDEARRLLRRLESEGVQLPRGGAAERRAPTRYTQAVLLPSGPAPAPSGVETALLALDPDRLTPIEALAWVSEWRRRLGAAPREDAP